MAALSGIIPSSVAAVVDCERQLSIKNEFIRKTCPLDRSAYTLLSRRTTMKFIPYLNFAGKAEEAMKFYSSALGGELSDIMRFGDKPNPEIPAAFSKYVLHAELKVGDLLIYFSDSPSAVTVGNNVSLLLDCESEKQLDEVFALLSAGGKVDMPPQKMFWKAYYANFTDKYGVSWQLNFSLA
jgi:PhnB protein